MLSVAFMRRTDPDGSRTFYCAKCQTVVTATFSDVVLGAAEDLHICRRGGKTDFLLSHDVTFTERVLTFLEGHYA